LDVRLRIELSPLASVAYAAIVKERAYRDDNVLFGYRLSITTLMLRKYQSWWKYEKPEVHRAVN
jgi:hypothetical protein